MLRLIFRKQNYLLFMAAAINLSLIYAPLAYAANYSRNVYAWLYGSSITLERADPTGGAANYSSLAMTDDWMLFCFAALAFLLGLSLAILMFVNRRPAFKKRMVLALFFLLLLQALVGWLLESHLVGIVRIAGSDAIETRLQAQYWLHIFPPLFSWWAWHSVRRTMRREGRDQESEGKVETVLGID